MIYFFQVPDSKIIALEADSQLEPHTTEKLEWLFGTGLLS